MEKTGWFDWVGPLIDKMYEGLLGLLPDWLGTGFADISSAMGPIARYFAYLAGLDVVPAIIIGAYGVRFLIRRIPFIG